MKDFHDIVREASARPGETFALATLVRAQGSSYRRPGARMLVCQDGRTTGSLSGGCLEEEVAVHARQVLQTGEPLLMSFDTRRRFGCSGSIEIFIERIEEALLGKIGAHLKQRIPCSILTTFALPTAGEAAGFPILNLGTRLLSGSEFLTEETVDRTLLRTIPPPLQVLVYGDGPDSKPIHQLGKALGWSVIDIEDSNSVPETTDEWTAAIVKSHNYGRDFAALKILLPRNLRYVGLVGPRKRRDQLLHDLLEVGVAINAGFFAPAGVDLGAETPEEIALAIVSEIQRVFAGATGMSLRERKMPIHAAVASESDRRCRAPLP